MGTTGERCARVPGQGSRAGHRRCRAGGRPPGEVVGYVTAFDGDDERPGASNVNDLPGQVVPNLVLAEVSSEGTVCIFTKAETHVRST